MKLSQADRKKLLTQLDRLVEAVEELLLSGLTTASQATTRTLGVTFQEASRLRFLRLSGTLRIASEELSRYTRNDTNFSERRLIFFLGRAWLLGKGISRAIREDDARELERLMWTPPIESIDQLNLVTLGVVKKVASGAFCAFEFRLRSIDDGQSYLWSTVFPLKSGVEIPPEGFLHIPQPQKFTASIFLEKRIITLKQCTVSRAAHGAARIQLCENSVVTSGEEFSDWDRFLSTSEADQWAGAARHVREHEPGPFDLDVELQEEVVLTEWELGPAGHSSDGSVVYPLSYCGVSFDGRVSAGIEGKSSRKALDTLGKKKQRPPLFGVLHYETCRLVLQPLTFLTGEGPNYITISGEAIDRKALLQTLKFR